MFSDPQSVTVATVAKSMPRVGTTLNASRYQSADRARVLSISHSSGRRNQERARLDLSKIITDPLASDRNLPVSMSTYIVVDTPPTGFTNAEIVAEIVALADWLKASGNADRLVGGEI